MRKVSFVCYVFCLFRNTTGADLHSLPVAAASFLGENPIQAPGDLATIIALSTIGMVVLFVGFGFLINRNRGCTNGNDDPEDATRCLDNQMLEYKANEAISSDSVFSSEELPTPRLIPELNVSVE